MTRKSCTHRGTRLHVWTAWDVREIDGEWQYVKVFCLGCCACGHSWTQDTIGKARP